MTGSRIITGLFLLLLSFSTMTAQELNVSPYSIFGIGDIHLSETGRTTGIASALTGLAGGHLLNTANPAALAALDSNTFIFDMAGSAKGSRFSSNGESQKSFSANFNRITAGLHITNWWSGAVTFQPYSTVSYKVRKDAYIEGTDDMTETLYEGAGGVNRISLLNSVRLTRGLSLGADMMMLYGNIDRDVTQSGIKIRENSVARTFSFSLGMLYRVTFSDELHFAAGLTYGYDNKLLFTNKLMVIDGAGNTVYDDRIESSTMKNPGNWAAGLSLTANRMTFAADYRYNRWSMIRGNDVDRKFTDTHTVNLGMELSPGLYSGQSYLNSIIYQTGISLSNSYLTLRGENPLNLEITAGAGLPFRTGGMLNIGLVYGRRGTTKDDLIKENYLRMTLSISLAERMFLKRVYD